MEKSLNTILLLKNQMALFLFPSYKHFEFLSFKARYLAIITLETSVERRIEKQWHCYMSKIVLRIKMVFMAKINSVTGNSSLTPQALLICKTDFK